MQRNRESAHQSRQRKRMQMDEVEQRCEQLKQHNSQLNQLVGHLTAENIGLKQQLVHVCQQTGHPLPPPTPSAMHPYGFGHMGMPMSIPAPKVRCHLLHLVASNMHLMLLLVGCRLEHCIDKCMHFQPS